MPFFHHNRRYAFPLIAGLFFALAFAPFSYSYLALLALLVLFTLWRDATPKYALLSGYLFGLGEFGLGVSWVYISIHDFGGADRASSALLTSLFVGFWALFPAITGWLTVRLLQLTKGEFSLLITPLVWSLMEYYRGMLLLNGFPWFAGAYSQLDTPLAGYIPLFGAYGTGFLLALSAALVLALAQRSRYCWLLNVLLLSIWFIGNYLQTEQWTYKIGKPLRVAMVQGNIGQDQKWKPENRLDTLMLYKRLSESQFGKSDIVIWPETAIPALFEQVYEPFLVPLSQAAKARHTDLIVSAPLQGKTAQELYNAVFTLNKTIGVYRKNHLLPFGEYMPWQPVSGFILKLLAIHLGDFSVGGDNQALLSAGGYAFSTSICYEDAFGSENIRSQPDAAYLVNVTNDAWFGDSLEPHQHLQLARMRALETGRYLLRATNTGITAIISPQGSIIKQAPLFETTVLTGKFTPMGGLTPYAFWGDVVPVVGMLIMLVTVLLMGLVRRHFNSKSSQHAHKKTV